MQRGKRVLLGNLALGSISFALRGVGTAGHKFGCGVWVGSVSEFRV